MTAEDASPPLTLGMAARVAALVGCGMMLADAFVSYQLSSHITPSTTAAEARAMIDGLSTFNALRLVAILASAGLTLAWIFQATTWLAARNTGELKHSPALAAGGFFIPLYNLFHPYLVAGQLEAESAAQSSAQREATLVNQWFAAWLLGLLMSFGIGVLRGTGSVHMISSAMSLAVFPALVAVVSQSLWVKLLAIVDQRMATVAGEAPAAAQPWEVWHPTTTPAQGAWAGAVVALGLVAAVGVTSAIDSSSAFTSKRLGGDLDSADGLIAALDDQGARAKALARLANQRGPLDKAVADKLAALMADPRASHRTEIAKVLAEKQPQLLTAACAANPTDAKLVSIALQSWPLPEGEGPIEKKLLLAPELEPLLMGLLKSSTDRSLLPSLGLRIAQLDLDPDGLLTLLEKVAPIASEESPPPNTDEWHRWRAAVSAVDTILVRRLDLAALSGPDRARVQALKLNRVRRSQLGHLLAEQERSDDLSLSFMAACYAEESYNRRNIRPIDEKIAGLIRAGEAGPLTIAALIETIRHKRPEAIELALAVDPESPQLKATVLEFLAQPDRGSRVARELVRAGKPGAPLLRQGLMAGSPLAARTLIGALYRTTDEQVRVHADSLIALLESPDYAERFASESGSTLDATRSIATLLDRIGKAEHAIEQLVANGYLEQTLAKLLRAHPDALARCARSDDVRVMRGALKLVAEQLREERNCVILADALRSEQRERRMAAFEVIETANLYELGKDRAIEALQGFLERGAGEHEQAARKHLARLQR